MIINNNMSVQTDIPLTFNINSGYKSGYIELYTENDIMNPYKVISINNLDDSYLINDELAINLYKSGINTLGNIYVTNKTQFELSYIDGSQDHISFVDKLPSTYYISSGNVTMLDYTNYEEDYYLMTYGVQTGSGAPTLQWAS